MKEYKENEIRKDLFFEDQKREAKQDAMRKKIDAENKAVEENTLEQGESNEQEIEQKLQEVDPWMKAKFNEATTTETDKTLVEEVSVDDTEKTL